VDCAFCAIVAGRAESVIVWDDDRVVAFMDHNPVTDGHVLVVPKAIRWAWTTSTRRRRLG